MKCTIARNLLQLRICPKKITDSIFNFRVRYLTGIFHKLEMEAPYHNLGKYSDEYQGDKMLGDLKIKEPLNHVGSLL